MEIYKYVHISNMSILLAIGYDDLEDGEILSEDDMTGFTDIPESSKLHDIHMKDREVIKNENNIRQKCEQDKKKRHDLQNHRKKMYRYQYQNPKWNGVTKCHANVSWWDQFQETWTSENHSRR